MNLSHELATHLRQLYTGGNWTSVNLKDTLSDVGWEQATTRVASFNTIAALVYHINYYVDAVLKVLEGGPLEASDKYSFAFPPIESETQWKEMVERSFVQAERFATAIEALPEETLGQAFAGGQYGSYYRNIQGIIEHAHYHLGQIVMVKKSLKV